VIAGLYCKHSKIGIDCKGDWKAAALSETANEFVLSPDSAFSDRDLAQYSSVASPMDLAGFDRNGNLNENNLSIRHVFKALWFFSKNVPKR
jgi:hypothetical protein